MTTEQNTEKVSGQLRNAAALGAAFVVGAAGIVFLRIVIEDTRLSAGTAAALAVAVVIGLGLYYVHNHIDDREQEGDNLYYLGLLFTLVSLMYALVALFLVYDIDDDLTERTYELLGNFGIALSSTVAGILARIAVQNYQIGDRQLDPAEIDRERSAEGIGEGIGIGAAARKLRRQLMTATQTFRIYNDVTERLAHNTRMKLNQTMETSSREMQTKARAALGDITEAYQQTAKGAQKIQTATEESVTAAHSVLEGFTDMVTKTAPTLESFKQRLEGHAEGLTILDRQARATAGALAEQGEQLAMAWEKRIETFKEEREYSRRLYDELAEWRTQSKKLMHEDVALWKEQSQRLHEACEKVERTAEHWTVLGTQAAATTEALKVLERTAQTTLRSNHRRHWWSPWRNR